MAIELDRKDTGLNKPSLITLKVTYKSIFEPYPNS